MSIGSDELGEAGAGGAVGAGGAGAGRGGQVCCYIVNWGIW